jgi:HEAT repeats
MKKHLPRTMIYLCLGCLTVLVLSHPYTRQSLFGPKIRGIPFCAWQQDTRNGFSSNRWTPTFREKVFESVGIHASRFYIDDFRFPCGDPDMLHVLISLADDEDDEVRRWVALYLGRLPHQEEAIASLDRLADDPAKLVRDEARASLVRCKKSR